MSILLNRKEFFDTLMDESIGGSRDAKICRAQLEKVDRELSVIEAVIKASSGIEVGLEHLRNLRQSIQKEVE